MRPQAKGRLCFRGFGPRRGDQATSGHPSQVVDSCSEHRDGQDDDSLRADRDTGRFSPPKPFEEEFHSLSSSVLVGTGCLPNDRGTQMTVPRWHRRFGPALWGTSLKPRALNDTCETLKQLEVLARIIDADLQFGSAILQVVNRTIARSAQVNNFFFAPPQSTPSFPPLFSPRSFSAVTSIRLREFIDENASEKRARRHVTLDP